MTISGKLNGKVAIVTGGAGGFGAGIVKKFVSEGAQVVIVDIQHEAATKVAEQWPPSQVVAVQADVASEADWTRVLDLTLKQFRHLDVVVNNAGVVHNNCPSIELDEAVLDRLLRVNLKSLFNSTKLVIPYFLGSQRPGLFINVSSISAARPRPGLVWYAASKAALTTASRGLAVEWAAKGIRFNVIQPAIGETAMAVSLNAGPDSPEGRQKALQTIPLGRMTTPEDIGNTAAWLASDEATMLTGATIDVDGGRGV